MNKTIVIYHGGCRDGFCAAWVVNKYFTTNGPRMDELGIDKIEYYAGYYGQEPPDVKDCDVIIVDFSYQLSTMIEIFSLAKTVIWLDHHKTAEPIYEWLKQNNYEYGDTVEWVFDNNRSGAGLAWDYFFPNQSRPWLVDYVEDRDLWRKKLPSTDEINSYIACLEFDFNRWNIAEIMSIDDAERAGSIAQAKTDQYVREVCKNVYFSSVIKVEDDGAKAYSNIPIVNIAQVDCSEVLHELCKLYPQSPFSLYWFKRADGMYQYGMRSIGDFDVSSVAKLFEGGGHKSAAGFQLNYLLEELK